MKTEQEIKERISKLVQTIDKDGEKNLIKMVAIRELEWVLDARITTE